MAEKDRWAKGNSAELPCLRLAKHYKPFDAPEILAMALRHAWGCSALPALSEPIDGTREPARAPEWSTQHQFRYLALRTVELADSRHLPSDLPIFDRSGWARAARGSVRESP